MVSSSGATARPAGTPGRRKRDLRRFFGQFRVRLHTSVKPVLLSVCVFLLSFVRWFHIPSPFAAALLLAFADKPSPMMLLGLAASLLLRIIWGIDADWWQYAGCGLLWLLLQKCRPRAGVETAALGGLAMLPRIAAALWHGAQLPIVYSCAALPMAMLFSSAMRYGTDAVSQSGATARALERFCMLLIVLLSISGLGFFRVGSVNLGQIAAACATAVFAHLSGAVYGVIGGLMCGLSLAFGGHSSALTVPLTLLGLLGGLPGVSRKRWLMIPSALAANALSAFVSPGAQPAIGWWAAGLGALAYLLIPQAQLDKLKPWLKGVEAGDRSMENAFVSQRIAHMREAIENLARALPQRVPDLLSEGEELGGLMCARCSNRELCWGRSRTRTERMLTDMMELTRKGEAIDENTLPALAQHGCLHAQEAGDFARDAMLLRQRKSAAIKKARYERELTLTHLAALSGTLGELGTMAAGESYNDLRAAHVISLTLEELGLPARLSYARRVDGHLQAALECGSIGMGKKQLDQLLQVLAKEEDMPLSVSRAEKGSIELEEIPLYSASVGMASLSAEEAQVCGDACSAKRCEGGRLLMMLSDGMGHGEEAHIQSEKTIELLLLLLEAGYTRHQAITAVNGMLLGAQEELFSTVDLADVDLWTGDVSSEKLGACASWVVRGNHMKKIEGSSLPLGILEEASSTAAQYRLHSGDILILMSDGVADAFGDDSLLKNALMESLYIQPQRMADALLRNALLAAGGTPRDDMSVMVLLLMDRQHSMRA